MEGDSSGYPSNVKEQGGGKPDYSFGVDGVVCIPRLDRGFQALGRKSVFPDKSPIDARDTRPTVYEGSGVNGFHCMRRDDELDWDLHSR